MDPSNEGIHFLMGVICRERGPGRGGDAETGHHRLRTVVAGPNRDSLGVEYLTDVMRVNAIHGKAQNASPLPGSAYYAHAQDL
jgi:hypothetical protein